MSIASYEIFSNDFSEDQIENKCIFYKFAIFFSHILGYGYHYFLILIFNIYIIKILICFLIEKKEYYNS